MGVDISMSLHDTASNTVHGSLNVMSHYIPICTTLGEFVNLFCSQDAVESIIIGNDGGQLFRIGGMDEIDLSQFPESLEVEQ